MPLTKMLYSGVALKRALGSLGATKRSMVSLNTFFTVHAFPGDTPGRDPDIYPPGSINPPGKPGIPQRDPDLYPRTDDLQDTDRKKRDGNPDIHPPRFPSPDVNPADLPKVPEPATSGVDMPKGASVI